jgi:O-antigen/teichoic acid export membrane protein
MLFVLGFGAVAGVVDWFVSPLIVDALRMNPALRPESLFLFRTLGILLTFGLAHQLVVAVIVARQRFDRAIQAGFLCYVLWVVGLVWVVHHHEGLRGVAVVYVAQQIALVVVIVPTTLRYLTRKGLSLLPWAELRELFAFSAKMQVSGFAGFFNAQLDTLVVGGVLSVRTLGFYNAGNSFATQLSMVITNVLGPSSVHLGNTYGKEGPERAFEQFRRMQRVWVTAVSGWCAVGMAAAYFGVIAWLGPQFHLGGWVAVAVIAGNLPVLGASMVVIYVAVMRQAGIEMRYGLIMVGINLVLMLPLALVGALAVAIAAGVAQLVSAAYLVHMARRKIRPDIPNFFRMVPVVRAAVAGLVTLLLELRRSAFSSACRLRSSDWAYSGALSSGLARRCTTRAP